jgi:hypothetical protein
MTTQEISQKWANQEEVSSEEVTFLLNNTEPVNHARVVRYEASFGTVAEIRDVPGKQSSFVFYKDGDGSLEKALSEFDAKWSDRNGRHTWFKFREPSEVIIINVSDYKGEDMKRIGIMVSSATIFE